jgi:hypothetical protein
MNFCEADLHFVLPFLEKEEHYEVNQKDFGDSGSALWNIGGL